MEHLHVSSRGTVYSAKFRSGALNDVLKMPESGNLLVGIRMKKTVKVDVKGPIMSYIKRVYGSRMAEDAAESLDELQELRNQVHSAGVIVLVPGFRWLIMM